MLAREVEEGGYHSGACPAPSPKQLRLTSGYLVYDSVYDGELQT